MHANAVWAAALALSGAANVAAMTSADHIEITRALANKPVKRDVDRYIAVQKRDLRMQQHQEALVNIEHNSNDPEAIARQEAVLKAAQEMEASAAQRRKRAGTDGSDVPMIDLFDGNVDILYMANISIGTPAQVFSVVPDTGSADLWVPSTAANDPNHNEFNSAASSTFNATQDTFVDTYGLGRAAGRIVSDTVTFGGYTIRNKAFGLATQTDSQFKQQANDGIIGMANSLLSNQSVPTFFERLILNGTISNPYFGVYLARGRDSTNQPGYISGSNLCLGCMATPVSGVSTSGSLNYVNIAPAKATSPLNLFYFYEVPLNGIYYNGANISGTYTQCIIDTGTTALYFPTTVADNMMAKVNGRRQSDGSYIVPASNIQSSTSFGVNLGGTVYNISMLDLIDGYTDSSRQYFLMNVYAADTPDPNNNPLAILGDVFIKNVLTVFSYSTNGVPAVGFQQLTASSNGAGATGTVQSGTGLPPGVPTGSRTGSYSFGGTGTASATSRSAAQSKIGGVSPVAALVGGTTVLLATLFGGLVV